LSVYVRWFVHVRCVRCVRSFVRLPFVLRSFGCYVSFVLRCYGLRFVHVCCYVVRWFYRVGLRCVHVIPRFVHVAGYVYVRLFVHLFSTFDSFHVLFGFSLTFYVVVPFDSFVRFRSRWFRSFGRLRFTFSFVHVLVYVCSFTFTFRSFVVLRCCSVVPLRYVPVVDYGYVPVVGLVAFVVRSFHVHAFVRFVRLRFVLRCSAVSCRFTLRSFVRSLHVVPFVTLFYVCSFTLRLRLIATRCFVPFTFVHTGSVRSFSSLRFVRSFVPFRSVLRLRSFGFCRFVTFAVHLVHVPGSFYVPSLLRFTVSFTPVRSVTFVTFRSVTFSCVRSFGYLFVRLWLPRSRCVRVLFPIYRFRSLFVRCSFVTFVRSFVLRCVRSVPGSVRSHVYVHVPVTRFPVYVRLHSFFVWRLILRRYVHRLRFMRFFGSFTRSVRYFTRSVYYVCYGLRSFVRSFVTFADFNVRVRFGFSFVLFVWFAFVRLPTLFVR
jgi:hypothetical protein